MSFEAAVTAGFIAGYGYVARETYNIYKGTSMTKRLRSGRTYAPALVTPVKKRRTGPTYSPSTMAPSVHRTSYNPMRTSNWRTLGRRPGKFATRKVTFSETNTSITAIVRDKRPQLTELVFISKAGSAEENIINKRRGDLANVRGVKFKCVWSLNKDLGLQAGSLADPIRVRWSIVVPKANLISTTPETNGKAYAVLPNFFINENPTTKIAKDFPTGETPGNHFEMFHRKINREEYSVLREGQFVLSQDGSAGELGTSYPRPMKSYHNINVYVPIKRQMIFSGGGGAPDANAYFVWWYAKEKDFDTAISFAANVQKPVDIMHEKTIYFSNSHMFK